MKQAIIYLVILILYGTRTPVNAQDFLEPMEDFWSMPALDYVSEVRDTLLLGFQLRPLLRVVSMPDDGKSWAVSIEHKDDSSFFVRSALASGDFGFRSMESINVKKLLLSNSRIERNIKMIDSTRAELLRTLFYHFVSNARYSKWNSNMMHRSTIYFFVKEHNQFGKSVSARIESPQEEKPPKLLADIAHILFQYTRCVPSENSQYLNKIDLLSQSLKN